MSKDDKCNSKNLNFDFEDDLKLQGFEIIVGIDEAGRGPLAGPVVASAVSLTEFNFENPIRDSKLITPLQRQKTYSEIFDKAHVGIGIISAQAIDYANILSATFCAMTNAIKDLLYRLPDELTQSADFKKKVCLLVDGNRFVANVPYKVKTIVGGDRKVASIACASIIAKVTRDRILNMYDQVWPLYGFSQHKGYGTKAHREAIKKYGRSPIHRTTFHVK